jgi:hypothetical protein
MFNGVKNHFHSLRYENSQRRRKVFWLATIILFLIITVVWILFFNNTFLNVRNGSLNLSSDKEITSLWQDAKNNFNSISVQIKDAINQLMLSSSSTSSVGVQQSTSSKPDSR